MIKNYKTINTNEINFDLNKNDEVSENNTNNFDLFNNENQSTIDKHQIDLTEIEQEDEGYRRKSTRNSSFFKKASKLM